MGYWEQRRVLVTGGGSFIGSHLVEALLGRGAHVRVAEDFSSGRRENLSAAADGVELRVRDLRQENRLVLGVTGHRARIETVPSMHTGPLNRVADNSRAGHLLRWRPEVPFAEGLRRTVDWYVATKDRDTVRGYLAELLTGRPASEGWGAAAEIVRSA